MALAHLVWISHHAETDGGIRPDAAEMAPPAAHAPSPSSGVLERAMRDEGVDASGMAFVNGRPQVAVELYRGMWPCAAGEGVSACNFLPGIPDRHARGGECSVDRQSCRDGFSLGGSACAAEAAECAICLDAMEPCSTVVLRCGHMFHKECALRSEAVQVASSGMCVLASIIHL